MKGYIQLYRDTSAEHVAMEKQLQEVAKALNLNLKVEVLDPTIKDHEWEIGIPTPQVTIYFFATYVNNDQILKFLENFTPKT